LPLHHVAQTSQSLHSMAPCLHPWRRLPPHTAPPRRRLPPYTMCTPTPPIFPRRLAQAPAPPTAPASGFRWSKIKIFHRCPKISERRCSIRQSWSLWSRNPAAFLPRALLYDQPPALESSTFSASSSPPNVSSGPALFRLHISIISLMLLPVQKTRGGDQGWHPDEVMHADDAQGEARPGYVSGDARSVGGSQLLLPRQEPPGITKWVLLPYHFGGIFLEIAVYSW
jgi:hypothetical protein